MPPNRFSRRELFAGAVAAVGVGSAKAAQTVQIRLDSSRTLGTIPPDFIGLGYEISSVSVPGLLSSANRTYVQLLKTLGPAGSIRIGGNTSDYASFTSEGKPVSAPKGTVVTSANLEQLGSFLAASGWNLIWGLNLGDGNQQQAGEEAQAVAAAVKDKLAAFEIGNEPDLFGRGTAHRSGAYSYDDYLKEYRRFKAAIRSKLPHVQFAGPDVASATEWVTRFAADEGNDLKLLTHHYYRECKNPTNTLDKLLRPDPKLFPELEKLKAASSASQVPYRICETNSFCGGGAPGISDTFGAALWVLDFMFNLAINGCAGVNMETGVNQLGFISSYSPIADDESGNLKAKPAYYGMLAFAQTGAGRLIPVDCDTAGLNLTAYAVDHGQAHLSLVIVNKEEANDAAVTVAGIKGLGEARALRLAAPSLQAKNGVTLGGASVDASGQWKPGRLEPVQTQGGRCDIRVPAASAAILTWAQ